MTNAFIARRIDIIERALLASGEPTLVVIRGCLPDDEQPAIAQTVVNDTAAGIGSLSSPNANSGNPPPLSSSSPTRSRGSQAWRIDPSESRERFYDRVLAEAGGAPFVVFGGLQDQGELPAIYRSEL
jgi:hypothetical protein